jgi:hypothetical protein
VTFRLHPPPAGRPWWGEYFFASFFVPKKVREKCFFASFSAPEKVRDKVSQYRVEVWRQYLLVLFEKNNTRRMDTAKILYRLRREKAKYE